MSSHARFYVVLTSITFMTPLSILIFLNIVRIFGLATVITTKAIRWTTSFGELHLVEIKSRPESHGLFASCKWFGGSQLLIILSHAPFLSGNGPTPAGIIIRGRRSGRGAEQLMVLLTSEQKPLRCQHTGGRARRVWHLPRVPSMPGIDQASVVKGQYIFTWDLKHKSLFPKHWKARRN